ncbi:hypothetical protein Y657_004281 [Salmonella enterica subsp. enterica]|nr:hypothetical protein [Salmonella enterica subsp. enterica]
MSPNNEKIIGVFAFLAPGRRHIRTSSLPPYGVAHQKFFKRSVIRHSYEKDYRNVNSYDSEFLRSASSSMSFSII